MAVAVTPLATRVRMQLLMGVNGEGKNVYRNRTLTRIKTNASQQNILDVVEAIASLSEEPLETITRLDETDLGRE